MKIRLTDGTVRFWDWCFSETNKIHQVNFFIKAASSFFPAIASYAAWHAIWNKNRVSEPRGVGALPVTASRFNLIWC
jgi:hypothetical protein